MFVHFSLDSSRYSFMSMRSAMAAVVESARVWFGSDRFGLAIWSVESGKEMKKEKGIEGVCKPASRSEVL